MAVTEDRNQREYVGRGGLKLAHALEVFDLDVRGLVCADFGCSAGGFTDCLLRAGARRVHAVDTAYGQLDYRLRTDDRVVVLERTNALHAPSPEGGVDLVVVDLGWTPQRLAVPAALRWVAATGRIITLIKPHYEASDRGCDDLLDHGVLAGEAAEAMTEQVVADLPSLGVEVLSVTRSPVAGGKRARSGKGGGNTESLALLAPKRAGE